MTDRATNRPFAFADALRGTRHVFVKALKLTATVGVHEHEKRAPQRLIVSVDLTVKEDPTGHGDQLEKVVCYSDVVERIQAICKSGHVNLIETLAERIAESCLADQRVLAVRVRLQKPDAIADCASVGIEIERLQTVGDKQLVDEFLPG